MEFLKSLFGGNKKEELAKFIKEREDLLTWVDGDWIPNDRTKIKNYDEQIAKLEKELGLDKSA